MIHAASSLPLASKHKVSQIKFHPTESYLAVQSHDRSVEIFRIRSEEEVHKKLARRQKRSKEKKEQKKGKGKDTKDNEEPREVSEATLVDYFTPHLVVRASGKIRSFDFGSSKSGLKGNPQVCRMLSSGRDDKLTILILVKLFVALSSNAVEVYNIPPPLKSKDEQPDATRTYSVDLPGHRTDVRTLCLSSDDQILASASNGNYQEF